MKLPVITPERRSKLIVGVVCFALGVMSMWPPGGVLLDTVFPDAYERWECPENVDDRACINLNPDHPEYRRR